MIDDVARRASTVDASEPPPEAPRRELLGRSARGVLVAVLAFPLVVALVELRRPHWYPLLDMAQTEIRVRDVTTGHPPLIGLAGRIGPFGPDGGSHPGPLSFYALWPVWKLFGGSCVRHVRVDRRARHRGHRARAVDGVAARRSWPCCSRWPRCSRC